MTGTLDIWSSYYNSIISLKHPARSPILIASHNVLDDWWAQEPLDLLGNYSEMDHSCWFQLIVGRSMDPRVSADIVG